MVHGAYSFQGDLALPGDKSISQRALVLAPIARGHGRLENLNTGWDCQATQKSVEQMGLKFVNEDGGVEIADKSPQWNRGGVVEAGNSGTTARLFMGMAGFLASGASYIIQGDASLSRRPMERVARHLRPMGLEITYLGTPGCLPLRIEANEELQGIRQLITVPSAQVKSAVLLAALSAQGDTEIHTPLTRNHTELMLKAMGADIQWQGQWIRLAPGDLVFPRRWWIPGDFSAAAWWAAAAAVAGQITLRGVGVNYTRTGLLEILTAMGAKIRYSKITTSMGEPVADVEVRAGDLQGVEVDPSLIPRCIDELPVLAVVAAFARGRTVVRGAAELRVKESNRLEEIATLLSAFGVGVELMHDGFVVTGQHRLHGAEYEGRDHRMVMAGLVMAALTPGTSMIGDVRCVGVSYPKFLRDLRQLTGCLLDE